MDARTKAVKTPRKRPLTRGMKRVEVTVPAIHVALLRDVAARLRVNGDVRRIKAALGPVAERNRDPSRKRFMTRLLQPLSSITSLKRLSAQGAIRT
jgi:hypothetical protein